MSFGKKGLTKPSLTKPVAPVTPFKVPRHAASVGLLLALVAAAAFVYANWRYVVSSVYPPALSEMIMPYPRTERDRLTPYWTARLHNHRSDHSVIVWTSVQMRQICGPIGYPKWTTASPGYSEVEPDARNLYRVDLYGGDTLAKDVIEKLRVKGHEFCSKEFYFAMYDARLASAPLSDKDSRLFLDASQREIDRIKSKARLATLTEVAPKPMLLEPEMHIRSACAERWRHDYSMREHCEKKQEEARSWARGHHTDLDIAGLCAARWRNDWDMFAYCVKQQEAAKARVQ